MELDPLRKAEALTTLVRSDLVIGNKDAARDLRHDFDVVGFLDDERVRRDAGRQEDACADRAAFADYRIAADDCGARVDRHPVLDRGVPFLAPEPLPRGKRSRDETDALVHL